MGTSLPAPEARRVAVELPIPCDNHCVFCCREGIEDVPEDRNLERLASRLAEARATAAELTFVGGEPSGDPAALEAAIAAARAAGFTAIGLQSHGRHLKSALLGRLHRAGLRDLHLSIHGATAALHDHQVGREGAWEAAGHTLAAARALGLVVVVTTVLTRSNFRNLHTLPSWLQGQDVAAWTIAVPRVHGRARREFEAVIPRLGLALPHALRALDRARRRGLPAALVGAPHCLLGPYRDLTLAETQPRAFAPICGECPARGACPGVDPIYLARFAGDELAPTRLQPPRARLPSAAAGLWRLFVGPGRLAEGGRELATIVAPPRSARARAQAQAANTPADPALENPR